MTGSWSAQRYDFIFPTMFEMALIDVQTFGIGVTVAVILAVQNFGWNKHIWDVPLGQDVHGRQISISTQTLFLIASGLAKTSILVSYLRIAPMDSWFRRFTKLSIYLVVGLMVIFLVVLWTQCM